jgi:nitrite reductase (NADH) small subunit
VRSETELADELTVLASDIPVGGRKMLKVRNIEVGVFNIDGEYYAVSNWCPHEGGPVCRGFVSGTVVSDQSTGWKPEWVKDGEVLCCPWHGYEFEIKTGACINRGELRLRRYKVRNLGGKLQIEL